MRKVLQKFDATSLTSEQRPMLRFLIVLTAASTIGLQGYTILFNNFAAAEESNKRALAWIEHDLAPLLTGPATAVAGPVIVHTLA